MGYVIFLTNASCYWERIGESCKQSTFDAAFRIHEGKQTTGTLKWGEKQFTEEDLFSEKGEQTTETRKKSPRTKKYRTEDIKLDGEYKLGWVDYSKIEVGGKNGNFRYLLVKVKP